MNKQGQGGGMLRNVFKLKISEIKPQNIGNKTQNIKNKTSKYLLTIDSDKHGNEKRGLAPSTQLNKPGFKKGTLLNSKHQKKIKMNNV